MGDKSKRTLFCGNLSDEVTEKLLYELFLQAGPLESVKMPKDKSGKGKHFAFIVFKHEVSVPYTIALFKGIRLYGRELQLDYKTGAEPVRNKYLEILEAHNAATRGLRMADQGTASYSGKVHDQSSFHGSNTPMGDNLHHYNLSHTDSRLEGAVGGRCSQPEASQGSYEQSLYSPSTSHHEANQSSHKRYLYSPSTSHREANQGSYEQFLHSASTSRRAANQGSYEQSLYSPREANQCSYEQLLYAHRSRQQYKDSSSRSSSKDGKSPSSKDRKSRSSSKDRKSRSSSKDGKYH